uniref:Uncharacterized protein n=1 Tax=Sciurus vulgaris TaxID=55149 RepID=A0A8D2DC44_SCIVU
MTTSWRLKRRSTEARRAPRKAFSRAESPYTVGSSAPSTEASSTTYTVRPSAASAQRSSSTRRLLPLYGSPQNTTSGILAGGSHVQTRRVTFRVVRVSGLNRKYSLICISCFYPLARPCFYRNGIVPLSQEIQTRMASVILAKSYRLLEDVISLVRRLSPSIYLLMNIKYRKAVSTYI